MKKNKTLTEINLESIQFENEIFQINSELLKENSTIEKLDLAFNRFEEEGITSVFEKKSLKKNKTLKKLRFFNQIKKEQLESISQFIAENDTLEMINISENAEIFSKKENVEQLFDSLKKNSSVKELAIPRNEFNQDFQVDSLCQFIQSNPCSLKKLDLSENQINL